MFIGERIKELRQEMGLTQASLAEQLQISRSSLALYETGKRQVPNELLCALARFFDISADYILGLID